MSSYILNIYFPINCHQIQVRLPEICFIWESSSIDMVQIWKTHLPKSFRQTHMAIFDNLFCSDFSFKIQDNAS